MTATKRAPKLVRECIIEHACPPPGPPPRSLRFQTPLTYSPSTLSLIHRMSSRPRLIALANSCVWQPCL